MQSERYSIFNNELKGMNDYVHRDLVFSRLNISEAERTELAEHMRVFSAEMELYSDPEKKTSVVVKQMSENYKVIHSWVAEFRQKIKHSNKKTILEEDYIKLYIHKNKPRHRHTVPDSSPILELEHIEHLNARISAHHHATHSKGTKSSLPNGVDMMDWKWIVLDEQRTPDSVVYTDQRNTQTATLKLEFRSNQVAKFCHIVARYGITSGETGTSSVSLVFAIT